VSRVAVEIPLPPAELTAYVGGRDADEARYEEVGRLCRAEILSRLPEDWSFDGKRVLDFGCGAGRTLRHFQEEARVAEFYGCDIDRPSIAWLLENMSPPFHAVQNDEVPPLPLESDSFDLIYAISVFTHISDHWSAWLVELHRLLREGGLLFATIFGPDVSEAWGKVPANDRAARARSRAADRVGMNVLHYGRPWVDGGPAVFLSDWWIREHWGRAFDVVSIEHDGFLPRADWRGQGVVLLRKRAVEVTVEELERIDPTDPREIDALKHNIRQLHHESWKARDAVAWLEHQRAALAESAEWLQAQRAALIESVKWLESQRLALTQAAERLESERVESSAIES
jgi:SAM-dependent methyltransferase